MERKDHPLPALKHEMVDVGLKRVSEGLSSLHSAVQQGDGLLNTNDLRMLLLESEKIVEQAVNVNTLLVQAARKASHNVKFK